MQIFPHREFSIQEFRWREVHHVKQGEVFISGFEQLSERAETLT
jgi:hypothetical protein